MTETHITPLFPIGTPTTRGTYEGPTRMGVVNGHLFKTGPACTSFIPCVNTATLAQVLPITQEELDSKVAREQASMRDFYEANPHLA